MVPVTWAMLPAMLAWRPISVLMALAVASRCCLAMMVCCSKKRREEFVRVLNGAEGQDTRRIDFVQDGHFAIETGVARKRILFEVSDLRLNVVGAAADRADGGHRVHVRAIGEFDGRVLGLHAPEFRRVHSRQFIRTVLGERSCGLQVAGVDVGKHAGIDAVDPRDCVPEAVERSDLSPLREQRPVTGGHVLDELGHLQGEVELPGNFRVALLEFHQVLLELVVAKQSVMVVGWVKNDAIPELRGCGANSQSQHEQANQNLSFHGTALLLAFTDRKASCGCCNRALRDRPRDRL